MKTRIVKIGNSRGIRIPKPLILQTGLTGEVEILVDGNRLVIRAASPPRSGWAEAFRGQAKQGEDRLLDRDRAIPTRWDEDEWEWS